MTSAMKFSGMTSQRMNCAPARNERGCRDSIRFLWATMGWSVLLFVMFFMLMNRGMRAVLDRFPSLTLPDPITPGIGILQEGCTLLVILAATAVMAAIEGRRVADYGYAGDDKIKRLASGAGIGFACLSVLVGVLWAAGFLVFGGRDLGGFAGLEVGGVW